MIEDGGGMFMDDIRIYNRPLDALAAAALATPAGDDPPLLGDVDMDGDVDFLDIPFFIDVITNGGDQAEADIDGSGVVDFLDIPLFVNILTGA